MCVILACKTKKPTLEILQKCEKQNSDGGGVAWIKDFDGKYVKNMNAEEIHDFIQYLELPFVIHFRKASVGGKNELLTHPFEVTEKSELRSAGSCEQLLIHNGHINDWNLFLTVADVKVDDYIRMSDTRAIAMILSKHSNQDKFLDAIRGLNSKFILIKGKEEKFSLYGDFIEEDGISYSNMNWKYDIKPNYTRYYRNHDDYFNVDDWKKSQENQNQNQEKKYDTDLLQICYLSMSKKQRKKMWKKLLKKRDEEEALKEKHTTALVLTSKNLIENNDTVYKRIHEIPDVPFPASDKTKNLLGVGINEI